MKCKGSVSFQVGIIYTLLMRSVTSSENHSGSSLFISSCCFLSQLFLRLWLPGRNKMTCFSNMHIMCCVDIHIYFLYGWSVFQCFLQVLLFRTNFLCTVVNWQTAFPIENAYFPAETAKYDKPVNFSFNLLSSFSALLYLIWSASEAFCHLEVQWCV